MLAAGARASCRSRQALPRLQLHAPEAPALAIGRPSTRSLPQLRIAAVRRWPLLHRPYSTGGANDAASSAPNEWFNVSPGISEKIGKDLHRRKGHPLNLIKTAIEDYFVKTYRDPVRLIGANSVGLTRCLFSKANPYSRVSTT